MLGYLTITKKIGKQAQTRPSLADIHAALSGKRIACGQIDVQFCSAGKLAILGVKNNAAKSLKTIARDNPFLQPHYRQTSRTVQEITGDKTGLGLLQPGKPEQSFAEAIASKSKDLYIRPAIEWTIPGDTGDLENALRAIDGVLAHYPPKEYKYRVALHFNGLHFGPGTLAEVPKELGDVRDVLIPLKPSVEDRYSYCRFLAHEQGMVITTRCLLAEGQDAASKFVPDLFKAFANAVHGLKPNEVTRGQLASAEEAKLKQGQARDELAKRVGISSEEAQTLSVNHYQMLTPPQRFLLEKKLYEYMTGKPYAQPESLDPAAQLRQMTELYQALQVSVQAQTARQNIPLWRQNTERLPIEQRIDWEQKMYQNLTALPYDARVPGDMPGKECYLADLPENHRHAAAAESRLLPRHQCAAPDGGRGAAAKPFHLLRCAAPRSGARQAAGVYRAVPPCRMEAAQEKAAKHMQTLAEEGRLPHRLERYYFAAQSQPGQVEFVAYQQIWVPEGQPVPSSLYRRVLGYNRRRRRSQAGRSRSAMAGRREADPQRRLAGNEARNDANRPHRRHRMPRPSRTPRKIRPRQDSESRFQAVVGYEKVKQGAGSVGNYEFRKQLAEQESVSVSFDFGTWRQTIDCWFIYRGAPVPGIRGASSKLVLTGWPHPRSLGITSQELFAMAIENIAFMADVLEKERVPELRAVLAA